MNSLGKRPAPSPSTQSESQSQSQSHLQGPIATPSKRSRPAKRQKVTEEAIDNDDTPEAGTSAVEKDAAHIELPEPTRRTRHPGRIRRLAVSHPHPGSTLSGAKVGGKSKDLKTKGGGVQGDKEDMYVTRKGLGFSGYLKKGVAAFIERGANSLHLHAIGAAIPLCMTLALAIRDAVPGGIPTEQGKSSVKMEVTTATQVVSDEITPDDSDEEIVYQTRSKSVVQVTLSLKVPIAIAPKFSTTSRGGGSRRGKYRRS